MSVEGPRRLGRGLEALLGAQTRRPTPSEIPSAVDPVREVPETPSRVRLEDIRPNPFQPRKEFSPVDLRELEDSIRASGLLQPLLVRRASDGKGYELAAGERRLRAVTNLGWVDVPVQVRDLNDQELLAVALVENLQRADLNPIEEAEGYARLLSDFGLTQQSVATMVGKDRSTVANMLRILNLPASVRKLLEDSALSMGHARALLTLATEGEILALAREAVSEGLSVREVERRVRVRKPAPEAMSEKRTPPPPASNNPQAKRIEDELRKHFQTDAKLVLTPDNKGSISLAFYSADDLERLLDVLLGHQRQY